MASPPQDDQDDILHFSDRESQPKPSSATGILAGGVDPRYFCSRKGILGFPKSVNTHTKVFAFVDVQALF